MSLKVNSNNISILETVRKKLFMQTAKLADDRKGRLPLEISAITRQTYNNNSNKSTDSSIISTPTMNLILNIKDLGGKSVAETKTMVNRFAEALISKDSIANDGMFDVIRN